MQRTKETTELMKFLWKFNDIVYFATDENKEFSTEDFYQSCKDETLIDKLEDLWFNLPESEGNRKKYLELICNEFDETKLFNNWWYALLYYTWQGLINYFETNYIK